MTKKSKDSLGDRMKEFYENRTQVYLMRRMYTMLRIDGKAFHSYTKKLQKPFDSFLIQAMDEAARVLCEKIQGAVIAYVQSDEISILVTDFDKLETDAWFDGNVQKITSISASITTAAFNRVRYAQWGLGEIYNTAQDIWDIPQAEFDARVWQLPYKEEVKNYFVWRQQDATRNSIQSVAQSLYSQKQLHKKNQKNMQEMIFKAGQNWDKYPTGQKRGRIIKKVGKDWVIDSDIPVFTKTKEYLNDLIPEVQT